MVTITSYVPRTRKDGTTFIALEITGGVELVQSSNTGNFYATVRKCTIPSTFDENIAKGNRFIDAPQVAAPVPRLTDDELTELLDDLLGV
mgnify:CR=1 FL=1